MKPSEEEALARELRALNLLPKPAPIFPNPLIATLLEELLPNFRSSPTDPSFSADVSSALSTLGYIGPENPQRVLRFLISAVQAHRILSHKEPKPESTPDSLLADAISELQTALDVKPTPVPDNIPALVQRLEVLREAVEEKLVDAGGTEALGPPLLSAETVAALPAHKEECEAVLSALTKEYNLRRDMLLHRLKVTASAFARGRDPALFDTAFEHVREAAMKVPDVTMFEVTAARECMLRKAEAGTGGVRSVIMGSVPDRGGRVGTGGDMPAFRDRAGGKTVMEVAERRGKGKGGKGQKRRKR